MRSIISQPSDTSPETIPECRKPSASLIEMRNNSRILVVNSTVNTNGVVQAASRDYINLPAKSQLHIDQVRYNWTIKKKNKR